jgi:hypothetical protein
MFDDKRAVKAERFGLDIVVDESRKPSLPSNSGRPRLAAALPKAELHRMTLGCPGGGLI